MKNTIHSIEECFPVNNVPFFEMTKLEVLFILVFVETSELSTRTAVQLNGAYKKLPGLNAWELVKSVYLNGKFQTQWKQEALVGWYDEVTENTFLRRKLVSLPLPTVSRTTFAMRKL